MYATPNLDPLDILFNDCSTIVEDWLVVVLGSCVPLSSSVFSASVLVLMSCCNLGNGSCA